MKRLWYATWRWVCGIAGVLLFFLYPPALLVAIVLGFSVILGIAIYLVAWKDIRDRWRDYPGKRNGDPQ